MKIFESKNKTIVNLIKDKHDLINIEKILIDTFKDYKHKDFHENEYKLMKDLKNKFNKLKIPYFLKNAIVSMFSYKRNV